MSFLKNAQAKAEKLVAGNRGKIDKGLAKAGDLANRKTKGKHQSKIDDGLRKVSQGLDKIEQDKGGPNAGPPPAGPSPQH